MALTLQEVQTLARAVKEVADILKSSQSKSQEVNAANTAQAVDWNNLPAEYLDPDGTIQGLSFTGDEVANALGSLVQFENYYAGVAVQTGTHGANLELLAQPIAVQIRIVG